MKIELPSFVIADIFAESLLLIEDGAAKPAIKKIIIDTENDEKNFYLGNNEKNISIIVHDDVNIFLNDDCLQLLTKMLGACKLNMADVAIINIAKTNIDYTQLKEKLNPKVVLFFGVDADKISLPFSIPNYQVQHYASCKFLFAPALQSLLQNADEEKKKLWISLKKTFEI